VAASSRFRLSGWGWWGKTIPKRGTGLQPVKHGQDGRATFSLLRLPAFPNLSVSISARDSLARQGLFSMFYVNGQILEQIVEVAVAGSNLRFFLFFGGF